MQQRILLFSGCKASIFTTTETESTCKSCCLSVYPHSHAASVSMLARYLWSTVVQLKLDDVRNRLNNHKGRYQKDKYDPSGVAPAISYKLPEKCAGIECIQPVDVAFVEQMMKELGGDDIVRFVPKGYEGKAQAALAQTTFETLSLQNVWTLFEAMLPLMPEVDDAEFEPATWTDP